MAKTKRRKRGINSVVSPLQSHILEVLWKEDNLKVRQIHTRLKNKRFALTSIAVDLDRLYKKGFVTRVVETGLGGPHYIYSVKQTKEEFQKSILENTVNKLMDSFGKVAVDYFHERFSRRKKNDRYMSS